MNCQDIKVFEEGKQMKTEEKKKRKKEQKHTMCVDSMMGVGRRTWNYVIREIHGFR